MAVLAVVEGLRFFDHTLLFHAAPTGLMYNYRFAELGMVIYFLCMLALFVKWIAMAEAAQKQDMRYLIAFLSVFLFPMFFHGNYFGTMDVYAWILAFIALICIDSSVIPLLSFIATAICPMSLFTTQMMLLAVLLYHYVKEKKKRYLVIGEIHVLCALAGFSVAKQFGYFQTDAMYVLTFRKFIVACILLLPYLYLAIRFFKNMLQHSENHKSIYWLIAVLGLPGMGVYALFSDYSRVLFYGFVYYLALIVVLLLADDRGAKAAIADLRLWVSEHIAFPAAVVAYPFIIMTIWVSGPLELFLETFVAL